MDTFHTKYIKYKSKYFELKGYSTDSILKTKQSTSNINGAYYTKYMKYKSKYIKEKGQTGGVGKPCDDAFKIPNITIGQILREYDCDYNQINRNLRQLLVDFRYHDFVKTNQEYPEQQITVADLIKRSLIYHILKTKSFL